MMTRGQQSTYVLQTATEPDRPGADFAIAGGRICGTEHIRTGRACQDAFAWQRAGACLVAVVSDGCGSGRHSEVGAILGARLWVAALADLVRSDDDSGQALDDQLATRIWPEVRRRVTTQLDALCAAMGGSRAETVSQHFLFTLVGALVTPTHTLVYSLGDGAFAIDGQVREIGPFADNRPPYLGYDLLENRAVYPVVTHACVATEDITSVILCTDGIDPLLHPGGAEQPHMLNFCQPRYVRNRDAIRRRLAVLNRQRRDIDWAARIVRRQSGLFRDDVAVVAIQRCAEARA